MLTSAATRAKVREENNCNVPWAILMDLTSACNLKCTGCWAAEYGHSLNLTLEELDDIIEQAEALGTYVFLYSGGEPLSLWSARRTSSPFASAIPRRSSPASPMER